MPVQPESVRTSFAAGTKPGSEIVKQNSCGSMKEGRQQFYRDLSRKRSVVEGNHAGKCVILDVGGDRFVASRKNLERYPATR